MGILFAVYTSILAVSTTLALINLVIWYNFRNKTEYLFFSISSLGAGMMAFMDGISIQIVDPNVFLNFTRYYHIPLYILLISLIWFVKTYFKTGRKWLAIVITSLWSVCLIINFSTFHGLTYMSVTSMETFSIFGTETFNLPVGVVNPFRLLADFADLLILIFLVDATISVYKRGYKHKAIIIGGSSILFFLIAAILAPLQDISKVTLPPAISIPFVLILTGMSIELIREVLKVSALKGKLFANEKNWTSLLNEMQLIAVKIDPEGKVKFVNPYYSLKTGFVAHEILNKQWLNNFVSDSESEKLKNNFDISSGITPAHFQNRILTKKGEELEIFWSNIQVYNKEGKISGLLAIGNDITEQERSFREIEELKLELETENLILKETQCDFYEQDEIVCKSDTTKYALQRAMQVCKVDSNVLLEGETGVGKGLFAHFIHKNSKRRNAPFIHVNCAAIPSELLESELFGHVRGAFTGAQKQKKGRFELAQNGIIFLDEIGELSSALQPKLLRVLQDGEFEPLGSEKTVKVNVRVIAATNKELYKEVQKGNFREDLFYRLNVFPITIPPLRKRQEDIPDLINHFTAHFSKKYHKKITKVSKKTYSYFANYNWPGNIRELQNIIERAVITTVGDKLKTNGILNLEETERSRFVEGNFVIMSLHQIEKQHIENTLENCNWQIHGEKGAAKLLEINPSTLRSRMKKLNIERNYSVNRMQEQSN